jgi:hypothetical protein
MSLKFAVPLGGSSHLKARFAVLMANFENMVFSMGRFTYVQFSQEYSLGKYFMYF